MAGWVRDAESKRLVRSEPESEPDLESKPKPKPKLELKEMAQEKSLSDIFYPLRTTSPSYFNLPDLGPNVTFELRLHDTQMLPKFMGLEDAYSF